MDITPELRKRIAEEAARLIYDGHESDYYRAAVKIARRSIGRRFDASDLPSKVEVRGEVEAIARVMEQWEGEVDPYQLFRSLLLPLEQIFQDPYEHPEGDVLYHSLQVFACAREERPYDEEFLTAALLHDVGKAIDPEDYVIAGLDALEGAISERTAWLIENQPLARAHEEGRLGHRARRRLRQADDCDELLLLRACDRCGRCCGADCPDVDEAIDYLRELAKMWG